MYFPDNFNKTIQVAIKRFILPGQVSFKNEKYQFYIANKALIVLNN